MNYMKQVAEMLGVELDEEFGIKNACCSYRITRKNLEYYDELNQCWAGCSSRLVDILNGSYKIIKLPKPILDKKEKEYLSNVIKPFRNKVSYIYKQKNHCGKMEWIGIEIENDLSLEFPSFEIGTMYKGMELDKEYTLEDLGL